MKINTKIQIWGLLLLALIAVATAQDYFYDDGDEVIVPVFRTRRQSSGDLGTRIRRQGGGGGGGGGGDGVTGPVRTFVKTDEHAHFKWGVRHNVGHQYAG